nr:hypothetical protein [uncultured Duganella sp.]
MSHKEKLILHVLIGFVGYMVWALMAFFDATLRHDFLVFNIGMATGTIGLALRDMKVAADAQPPSVKKQAGFAQPALLAVMALSALLALSACSLVPQRMSAVQEGMAQTVVQSSERTICRDIPIGTWLRLYGANADRLKGWQSLCFNPVTAPLNAETISAILKVYPGFVAASRAVPPPVSPDSLLGVGAAVQSGTTTRAGEEGAK